MEGMNYSKSSGYGATGGGTSTLGDVAAPAPLMGLLIGKLDNLVEHLRENSKRLERVTDHTLGGVPNEKGEGGISSTPPGLMGEVLNRISTLEALARQQTTVLNRLEQLA